MSKKIYKYKIIKKNDEVKKLGIDTFPYKKPTNKRKIKITKGLVEEINHQNSDDNVGIQSTTGVYSSVSKAKDFTDKARELKKRKATDSKYVYNTNQTTPNKNYNQPSFNNNSSNYGNSYLNNSFVSKKFTDNKTIPNKKAQETSNKAINSNFVSKTRSLGSSVSKTIDSTVSYLNKANIDDNVGISSTTSTIQNTKQGYQVGNQAVKSSKNLWQAGRQSIARVQRNFAKRKAQQVATQQVKQTSAKIISSAIKQTAAKATASVATSIAPILFFILLMFILFFIIVAVIVPTSHHQLSQYPGTDTEVSESNQTLTGKAQELKASVVEVEENPAYSHIDEFRYSPSKQTILDSFDYDPFILLSYLSAKYQDYNMDDVKPEIDSILDEMFDLRFTEIVETRYDSDDDPYNYYILETSLVKKDLEAIVMARMNDKEKELYKLYFEETGDIKGNVHNPFTIDWYNHITCKMGWRYIDGKEDNHTGLDIGLPLGTPMKSGVTGTVTKITYASDGGSYGNRVEVSTPNREVTVLYAHMDTISVSVGDPVMAGVTNVGTLGSTGWSSGPHLHIEVFVDGKRIDPILVLSRF